MNGLPTKRSFVGAGVAATLCVAYSSSALRRSEAMLRSKLQRAARDTPGLQQCQQCGKLV